MQPTYEQRQQAQEEAADKLADLLETFLREHCLYFTTGTTHDLARALGHLHMLGTAW